MQGETPAWEMHRPGGGVLAALPLRPHPCPGHSPVGFTSQVEKQTGNKQHTKSQSWSPCEIKEAGGEQRDGGRGRNHVELLP